MIIDYDHNPNISYDHKLQSLKESVQMALNDVSKAIADASKNINSTIEQILSQLTATKTAFTPATGSAYSPWGGCYYIKLGHIVNLHLGISGLTAGTGNNVYTLPSEVRPSAQITAMGVGGSVSQLSPVIIANTGGITVYPQGNTYCTLDVTYIV